MKEKEIISEYQPNLAKLPFRYLINVKRGMIWSTRILEITNTNIKYFTPETNELRFNELIRSCELNTTSSKLIIELKSKDNNTFKSVQIKSEKEEIISKIKADFSYISLISSQTKQINEKLIEQENPVDCYIKSPLISEQNDKEIIEWHYYMRSQHCYVEYSFNPSKAYLHIDNSNDNLIAYLSQYFQFFIDEMKAIHKTHFKSAGFAICSFYFSLYAILPVRQWYWFHLIFALIFWSVVIKYLRAHYKFKANVFLNIEQDNLPQDYAQMPIDEANLQIVKVSTFFQNESILDFVNNCYRNIAFNQSWMDITDLRLVSINLYEYSLKANGSVYQVKRIINQIDEVTFRIIDWINEQKLYIMHVEQSKVPNFTNKMKLCVYIPIKTLINNNIKLSLIKNTIDQMDKIHLLLSNEYFNRRIQKNSKMKNDIEINTRKIRELFNKGITEWHIKEERRTIENHSFIKFYQIKNQSSMIRADILINMPIRDLYSKLLLKPFIINRNYYSIKLSAKVDLRLDKVIYRSDIFTASVYSWSHKISHLSKLIFLYCDNNTSNETLDKLVFNQPNCTMWMNEYKKGTNFDVLDDSYTAYNLLAVADSQTLLSYVECSNKGFDKEGIEEIFNSLSEINLIL